MCTTGPHTTQTPLRRCRVVITLCSDCVCGDPVRLVWLCVPLDHTQHKPHCVGVEWYLHSVAIACAVTQFAWFGCVYHWTTHNTNPLRRCRVVHSVAIACAVIQFAWFGCVYHWVTAHAIATECKYHLHLRNGCAVCCVWSSGTHSQTRRTGSPHTQSLQSVSTTYTYAMGFVLCVVQWYTQPNQANWVTAHAIATECKYHLHLRKGLRVCDPVVCGPVVHTAKPGELGHRTRNRYRV